GYEEGGRFANSSTRSPPWGSPLGESHLPEDQAVGRGDGADPLAIPGGDDLRHLFGPAAAQADIDAEPHQRADHLVTEGLRRHPEDDPVLLGPPAGLEHVTDRRRPRSLAAEAGEVVLPHEGGGSGV